MTARCSHSLRDDEDCATCADYGPAFDAWDLGGQYDRTFSMQAEEVRDAYNAGRIDGAAKSEAALDVLAAKAAAAEASRDLWHREFLSAAKYVEENARLHGEVRRLERELSIAAVACAMTGAASAFADTNRKSSNDDKASGC